MVCKRVYIITTNNISQGYTDPGWTEFNQFNRIELHLCKIGLRMSNQNNNGSFHGNNFETVIINIPENAVAWKIGQDCYYYNGRFNILAWAHSDTSDLLNCDGDCEGNVGNISIECGLKPSGGNYVSKIKGSKRFWFDGYLIVAGGNQNVSVEMANLPAGGTMEMSGFVCNNNLGKPNYVGTTGSKILPVSQFKEVIGGAVSPMAYGLYRENVASVGINTYTGPGNGLYLSQSGYHESIGQAKNGFYLDGSGNEIRSFASPKQGGFNVNTETGFVIRFGMVTIPQKPRDDEFEMRVILEAQHLISGRLYITTGKMDNAWAASAVYDIHTGPNTSPSNRQILVQESFGWDPDNQFAEKLNAEVKMPLILMKGNIEVLIGANTFKSEQILHFHFIGLIL